MGCELGSKERRSSLIPQVRFFVVAVALLLSFAPLSSVSQFTYEYDPGQLDAKQAIFRAWNLTPNRENNLAGSSATQQYPYKQSINIDPAPSYRGVQCLPRMNCQLNATDSRYYCSVFVIGL